MTDFLKKEDYEEPCCPLNMHPETVAIPVGRVLDKLDSYLHRNDYVGAERHLKYWCEEARGGNDARGALTVANEQIGLYRKCGREEECLQAISDALSLAKVAGTGSTVSFGTTLINAATGYKAFNRAEEALPLYREAQRIYEANLKPDDERLGGLYNNMALALTALGDFRKAEELYFKAIDVMNRQQHGQPEAAITYLNLADLVAAESGLENGAEKIEEYLRRAEELLNTENLPQDGNYAFVCEKCAPVFGYYGYFATERELTARARMIYERA